MKTSIFCLLLNIIISATCLTDYNFPSWVSGWAIGVGMADIAHQIMNRVKHV